MSPLTIQDFFNADNTVTRWDTLEQENRDIYVDAARAFSRNLYQPVYIVDFLEKEIIHISGNMRRLCGSSQSESVEHADALYFDYIPDEEKLMLKEIVEKTFELFKTFPLEEREQWSLSYSFHLQCNNHKRLVLHRASPLRMTPDGRVWLALCTFSLTSNKEPGSPVFRRYGHRDYFFYSLKNHVWYYREGVSLTQTERDVLVLSSQGFTMKEIASRICKSEDSVKSYKRHLFAKLGVKNITEAVCSAVNNDLLH